MPKIPELLLLFPSKSAKDQVHKLWMYAMRRPRRQNWEEELLVLWSEMLQIQPAVGS